MTSPDFPLFIQIICGVPSIKLSLSYHEYYIQTKEGRDDISVEQSWQRKEKGMVMLKDLNLTSLIRTINELVGP
jgi:hypothetical protein